MGLGVIRTYDAFGGWTWVRGRRRGDFAAFTRNLRVPPHRRTWGILHIPSGGELFGALTEEEALELLCTADTAYKEEWSLRRLEGVTGVRLLNLTEWQLFSDLIDDCSYHVHALWGSP